MSTFASFLDLLASSRALLSPLPRLQSTAERLRAFPREKLPLKKNAKVYWSAHQIPFIDAETDEDAAFLLGMVHAHLRLGQLEIYRRAVVGRLAEMAGPPAVALDWTLRLMALDRAVPDIQNRLGDETRAWLAHFVAGINHYRARAASEPYEVRALALKPEPWSLGDILRVSRLAAADVSWFNFVNYFNLRAEAGFDEFWQRYRQVKWLSASGTGLWGDAAKLTALLSTVSRTGSNSWAVGADRSRSGAPIVVNDPHLGVSLPNVWLIAGYRCPSYHVVGLMLPGLPFVALGRNRDIAWGGTNLHAQSSDIFDVSDLSDDDPQITSERQIVQVRFWLPKEITIRRTPWGPLISDSPLFAAARPGEKMALRWTGHDFSDELTAMLRANRARDADEFARAFEGYAVSGQNFLVADRKGHLAQVVAARVPKREMEKDRPWILDRRRHEKEWDAFWTPADFPVRRGEGDRFLASANDRPPANFPPVGEFFPPTDRVDRIRALLKSRERWDAASLAELQTDTYSRSSAFLKDRFVAALRRMQAQLDAAHLPAGDWPWLETLAEWDGHFRRESEGPILFQSLLSHYVRQAYRARYGKKLISFLLGSEMSRLTALQDLQSPTDETLAALRAAADRTSRRLRRRHLWGDWHRLRLGHWFQNIPVVGGKFRFYDLPADGSTETVRKTAHAVTEGRHGVHYGAQARHISDLGDEDANWFLILGGQDGWLRSENFDDLVALWEKGKMVPVPFRLETVARTFPTAMALTAIY